MKRALALAKRGLGFVNPNPMVGAIVLDTNGKMVGQGYHKAFGKAHAEVIALQEAGSRAEGGTLFVTLEPCCHHGKTPPCVDAIIKSKIKKVIVACKDPNPKMAGKGIAQLEENNIEVALGVEEKRAQKLNRVFFHAIKNKTPYVVCKVAMDRNGCMGYQTKRVQISSKQTENFTMKLRAWLGSVMIGTKTWKTDNPLLTLRGLYKDRPFTRILMDPRLEISPCAKVFKSSNPVLILAGKDTSPTKIPAKVLLFDLENGKMPAQTILETLYKEGITSLLIEGGPTLIEHFGPYIHEYFFYVSNQSLAKSQDAVFFPKNLPVSIGKVEPLGKDMILHALAKPPVF